MARPEKVAQVEAVAALFQASRSVILSDFTGLNVEKISQLRKMCREDNIEFHVVKNTLAKRGIEGTPAEGLAPHFEGPTAVAASAETENLPAKVLAKFAEEHEAPRFKAGFVDGNMIDATAVLALSKLPSREELLAKVLGGIQAPGNGLVTCLQGPLRNLLSVMSQIKEKQEA